MVSHASVLSYFMQAGLVVKTVMLLLIIVSITSWTLILQRAWFFRKQKLECNKFVEYFWKSKDISQVYNEFHNCKADLEGLARIFYVGFTEYLRLRQQGILLLDSIQRVMQITYTKELVQLEHHLPLFASIGSIAPYVGLFGTVWGIMTSFQALGYAQQATIAMVAPGISEALVATALGLFTAIPAVIAYNRYSTQAGYLLDQYQLFQNELIALIEQQTSVLIKGKI